MSTDSSKKTAPIQKETEPKEAPHASPSGYATPQKRLRSSSGKDSPIQERVGGLLWRRPHNDWGVIGGAFFGLLALFGPWFILGPLLEHVLPFLPLSNNLKLSIADALLIASSLLFIALAVVAYGKKLSSLGFTKITLQHIGMACGGFVLYFVLSVALATVVNHLLPFNQDQPQELGYHGLNGIELLAAFIPLVIVTPLAEESIFRGFMFTGFRRHLPFWIAAIGVSAIFGLAHGQVNVGLDVFTMSMVSCYLRESTKSLWPSIFLHALKNGVAFYLLYLYNGH